MDKLKRIKPGDKSLVYADEANKLIDVLNGLITAEVVPAGLGQVLVEPGKVVFDFRKLAQGIKGTFQVWFFEADGASGRAVCYNVTGEPTGEVVEL